MVRNVLACRTVGQHSCVLFCSYRSRTRVVRYVGPESSVGTTTCWGYVQCSSADLGAPVKAWSIHNNGKWEDQNAVVCTSTLSRVAVSEGLRGSWILSNNLDPAGRIMTRTVPVNVQRPAHVEAAKAVARQVVISGATGKTSSNINARYEQVEPEVYRNVAAKDRWLFVNSTGNWMVGTTAGKDTRSTKSTGWCYSVAKAGGRQGRQNQVF
eukprot:SAG31_NODE_227_length_19818_cov_6.503271_18_plen_211_part_00